MLERMDLTGKASRDRLEAIDEELRQTIAARRFAEDALRSHASRDHNKDVCN